MNGLAAEALRMDLSTVNLDDLPVLPEPGEWDHYLMNAVHEGSEERVRRALIHGANPTTRHPFHGVSALHLAVQADRPWAIPLLVAAGADVEQPMATGVRQRPLGIATCWNRPQALAVITALLAACADPNGVDDDGHVPLRTAVQRYEDPPYPHHTLINVLLDHGASTGLDREGNTPLHWFVVTGMPVTAQLLLDRGLPMVCNRAGRTPLQALAERTVVNDAERTAALRAVFEGHLLRQAMTGHAPNGLSRHARPRL